LIPASAWSESTLGATPASESLGAAMAAGASQSEIRRMASAFEHNDMTRALAQTGLSRMTIYRLENRSEFPQRKQLSPNSVGWLESEVDEWIATRRSPQSRLGTPAADNLVKGSGSPRQRHFSFTPSRVIHQKLPK
jgi:prophage regulatory protein